MTSARSEVGSDLGLPARCGWAGVGFAIAVADQLSKSYFRTWLEEEGGLYRLTSFLNLRSVENRGAAFGLFADGGVAGRWLLAAISVIFFIGVLAFILRYPRLTTGPAAAASLLMGGAIGNGWDRVVSGRVFDFIDAHLFGWHWPAFNLADAAISVSIMLIIWQYWRKPPATA